MQQHNRLGQGCKSVSPGHPTATSLEAQDMDDAQAVGCQNDVALLAPCHRGDKVLLLRTDPLRHRVARVHDNWLLQRLVVDVHGVVLAATG